jgi:hypothetical protein
MRNKFIYFISFIVSILIFVVFYETISYVKYTNNNKSVEIKKQIENKIIEVAKKQKKEVDFDEHIAFAECLEQDILADCGNLNIKKTKVLGINITKEKEFVKPIYKLFNDLLKSNIIIILIYLFLIYTLTQQLYLYWLAKQKKQLTEMDFHNAEWNINTAPMFGLLGTFFSIAILLSNSGNTDISTVLLGNFFDAVMTTIIGIIFYIINFKLKITIYPLVKFND